MCAGSGLSAGNTVTRYHRRLWGGRRWNVEGGFRVEKHGGFGLGHTFCNDDTAGRIYHVLMQIAYALWQVFDTGMLLRLSEGCRKPTQEMWAKMLFLALTRIWPRVGAEGRSQGVSDAALPSRGLNGQGSAGESTTRKELPLRRGEGGGFSENAHWRLAEKFGEGDETHIPQIWNP